MTYFLLKNKIRSSLPEYTVIQGMPAGYKSSYLDLLHVSEVLMNYG